MIYENFNRPPLFRFFERILFPVFSKTLGIMQVTTEKRITDAESVRRGIKKIKVKYDLEITSAINSFAAQDIKDAPIGTVLNATIEPIREVLKDYNKDDNYIAGVMQLQEVLIEKFYPSIEKFW